MLHARIRYVFRAFGHAMNGGVDLGFGAMVLVFLVAVAAVWGSPIAAAMSYLPDFGNAAFRHRPRVRRFLHGLTFLFAQAFMTVVMLLAMMSVDDGEPGIPDGGGPFRLMGVHADQLAFVVIPVVFFVIQVGAGELCLRWMSSKLHREDAPDGPPPGSRVPPIVSVISLVAIFGASASYFVTTFMCAVLVH